MGKQIRMVAMFVVLCGILLSVTVGVAETSVNCAVNVSDGSASATDIQGNLNWDNGVIQATGTGVPPAQTSSSAQANVLARRAAVVDAYRNLLEAVGKVRVDSVTTVSNYEVASDTVTTQISGLVQGARIANEQLMPDGSYQVTLEVDLFGPKGVAAAIEQKMKPSLLLSEPSPSPEYTPPAQDMSVYTGVIVDAQGLGLERAMSPRIYDETGRVIYGNMYLDPDMVVREGMVNYTFKEFTDTSRAGTHPIIVKAIGLREFNVDVVISKADADMILSANAKDNFLAQTAVVFEQ